MTIAHLLYGPNPTLSIRRHLESWDSWHTEGGQWLSEQLWGPTGAGGGMRVYICIGVLALFAVSAHGRSETNMPRPSRVCPKTSHLSSHRLSLCWKTSPPGLPHRTWHEILIGLTGNHDSPTRSRSDPSTPVPEALAFFRPSWESTGPRSDLDLVICDSVVTMYSQNAYNTPSARAIHSRHQHQRTS